MNEVDRRLPLYQRLRDQIAMQIAQNVWRPGEAIPTEAELSSTHGVAVGTVRKAVDALVADGMVERHQGRGTFVRRPSFERSFFRFFRYQEAAGGRRVPESRILEREAVVAPAHIAAALRLPEGAEVIRLSRLRLLDAKPILAEEIWLPQARFAPLLTVEEGELGDLLYPAYERLCDEIIARGEETLTAATADPDDVRLLGLTPGAAVIVIERLAFGYDGKPVEWRRTHGPAASFRYQIEIR
jgi:GntR family transcriptional regulator